MSNVPAMLMLSNASPKSSHDYLAARARVESHVAKLAQARRISLSVEVDAGVAFSGLIAHQIQLTYGRTTRVVAVDHRTFMDEKLFGTQVLHQLQDVVGELASTVDLRGLAGTRR